MIAKVSCRASRFAGARPVRITTPHATAAPETPARGPMVAEEPCPPITLQFAGQPIGKAPRSTVWNVGLGCTWFKETGGMLAELAEAAAVAGASGKTAPFFRFSCAHWPLFAPAAISCASYTRMVAASLRTLANSALFPVYCREGQPLISF